MMSVQATVSLAVIQRVGLQNSALQLPQPVGDDWPQAVGFHSLKSSSFLSDSFISFWNLCSDLMFYIKAAAHDTADSQTQSLQGCTCSKVLLYAESVPR
jgi:hypothetical protein